MLFTTSLLRQRHGVACFALPDSFAVITPSALIIATEEMVETIGQRDGRALHDVAAPSAVTGLLASRSRTASLPLHLIRSSAFTLAIEESIENDSVSTAVVFTTSLR